MCQNWSGTGLMLAALDQYWSGSGATTFLRIISRKDKSHVKCHSCKHSLMSNQCYQLVSGQYKPNSGTFTACSQRLGLQSHTLLQILQKKFFLTMISLIIISIFNRRSGQPHALMHCPHWMVFHCWPWKCIESPWLHMTIVLVPQEHFE